MTHPVAALTALLLAAVVSRLPVRWQVVLMVAVLRAVTFAVAIAHPLIPRPLLRAMQVAVREAIDRRR